MRFEDLVELHYITLIRNVPSILRHGIVCHRAAARLGAISIADPSVQDIRAQKRVPGGLHLHEYAPLYFNARNPMMYRRKDMHNSICVLRISKTIMEAFGAIISDHNAASSAARFYPAPDGLEHIDPEYVFAEYWTHENGIEQRRRKARICAEVLVPERVPPEFIVGAYVSGQAGFRALSALEPPWQIEQRPWMFFVGREP